MNQCLGLLCILFLFSFNLQAQYDHHVDTTGNTGESQHTHKQGQKTDSAGHHEAGKTAGWDHPEEVTADFEDFPNLHPLFVHFPVVLLPFAAFFQLLGLFIYKKELSWVSLILVLTGFIGGYIAASYVHPHVGELPQHAQAVYDKHAMYADWTLWLSGIAILLKVGSHFFLKRKIWAEGLVALVLLGSGFTVSMAGHHGSQLVFIENVGPQGNHLESGKHSH